VRARRCYDACETKGVEHGWTDWKRTRGVPAIVGWTTIPDVSQALAERRPGLIGRHLRRMDVDRRKEAWRMKTARRAQRLARTWQIVSRDLDGRAPERRKVEPGRWIIVANVDGMERVTVAEVSCPIPRAFSDETPVSIMVHVPDAFAPSGLIMRQVQAARAASAV
jgi:hypothetical protein